MRNSRFSRVALCGAVFLSGSMMPGLRAATIWTDWTSATSGAPGSASGILDGVAVSYKGEVIGNTVIDGTTPDWSNPASSFIGGTVTTSPGTVGDIIALSGTFAGTNTITFGSAIVNPVFAIWSLGQPSSAATFTFDATPTVEAGGPDLYGGGAITALGNVVSGQEGSGVVQFTGSFTSISWTDTSEFYYGFTVGEAAAIGETPEPASLALFGAGFAGLALIQRRRKSA